MTEFTGRRPLRWPTVLCHPAGSTARPPDGSIRGSSKQERHSVSVCMSMSCPAKLKFIASSRTPEHTVVTRERSQWDHVRRCGSQYASLLLPVFSFCSTRSASLPASHHGPAFPSVLYTGERNAASGFNAFSCCQKLKHKTPRHIVKVGTRLYQVANLLHEDVFFCHFLNVHDYLFKHI